MRKLYRSLLAAGAVFGLAACGDDVSVTPPAENPIAITGISVSPPSAQINVGQQTQFSASVQTNGGTGTIDLTVTWSSSNTAVATVNASGQVSGVSAGTAVITARSNGNNAYSAGGAVTVTQAVTPNALLAFSVNPTAASVQAGSQVAVSTNFTASPGATVTFANTSSNANCTVPATGGNPTITAVSVGTCVVTITASGSGTGLISNSLQASVAVTITSLGAALQSLTVNPTNWATVPGATQLVTTTAQAAAGATVTYANSTSNAAVATVTATGANPTITAVGNGSAQITITASGSGPNLQSNSLSATITVNVQAASVSISSLDTCVGGTCVPVNLAGVAGQIEATVNINSGNQQISSVKVYLGVPVGGSCTNATWVEAAGQIFGVSGAPAAPVTLSINTASFNPTTFAPLFLNGLECLQARIFPVSGPAPDASNTWQFTLTNADVVYFDATTGTTGGGAGLNHTGISAGQVGSPATIWWKGGFTFRAHPVLYSGAANVASITYTSTACGASNATGPNFAATFSCAGVQSTQNIANTVTINYVAGYTLSVSPTQFMTIGVTPGFVPGSPNYATVTTREDNVGPVTSITGNVAFNDGFDQFWVNASYVFLSDFGFVDAGVGVDAATRQVRLWNSGAGTCSGTAITTGADLAETVASDGSPDGYRNCASANDALGNVGGATGATNWYGVDKVAPSVRLAGSTAATPALAGTLPGVSAVANTTIYSMANPFVVTDVWGLEGQDTRSGFNQNVVAGFPAAQSVVNHVGASWGCGFTGAMGTTLSDNWVRTTLEIPFQCGVVVPGYFWYSGSIFDRAGNQSATIARNFAIDQYAAPMLTSILPAATFMTVGQSASFNVYGTDDLEVIEADLVLNYPGLATITSVAYPQSTSGVRWDQGAGALNTPVVGQILSVATMLGRMDETCSAAATPYASCAGADAVATVAAEFNNVGGNTDAEKRVTGVTATLYDVASQASAGIPPLAIDPLQLSGTVAQQWAGADLITWRLTNTATSTITAEHKASTSITAPYFDQVLLARAYGTTLVLCGGQFSVGQMTDNGFNRFFPYSVGKPTSGPCALAGGGLWYAIALKGGAALITQGL